ncbi:PemK family transcriptional regulator [[Phormidium ambiguum] IAM M-71]|uniref:mRNA interferase n=1 Tax=[Phormidium ambiguum] IAM M-71 TaxID=454136 RepID=A0A1U7IMU9_9CYAN|nr:type II toxin-antitoxin system PemK/MazF family toxin [Phormidium ambiguum]OKH38626.1 PemK family transcriptional regulator [Phormidium ambiguum IAM M-71]
MPNGILTYQRGEIRWVKLDPTLGVETKKTRPCLIVQNDISNRHSLLTIVMPFLAGTRSAPYAINVAATSVNGLDRNRYIDVAQIRGVDHQRIMDLIGVLEPEYWEQIRLALDIMLGFTI